MSIRQFQLHYNGDYSGNVQLENKLTNQSLEVPADVLFRFVAEALRREQLAKLEALTPAEVLGLPARHSIFQDRRDFIQSEISQFLYWCAKSTELEDFVTDKDGWHFWDEVGLHGGGPYDTEEQAVLAHEAYFRSLSD